jgi:hypothetical protein
MITTHTPPPPNPSDFTTPGSFRNGRMALWSVMYGKIVFLIYRNWFQATGDRKRAIHKAIYLSAVWKAWTFAAFVWVITVIVCGQWAKMLNNDEVIPMLSGYDPVDQSGKPVCTAMILIDFFVIPFFMGTAYVELVERSLFKHRIFYKVFKPVHRVLGWIPWPVLIMTVLIPFQVYVQLRMIHQLP